MGNVSWCFSAPKRVMVALQRAIAPIEGAFSSDHNWLETFTHATNLWSWTTKLDYSFFLNSLDNKSDTRGSLSGTFLLIFRPSLQSYKHML